MDQIHNKHRGSVSLFVVIFAALLIITIATAFIRIMLQDQMQATASDLSKSALDSAHAGVEDAKRAIVEYYQRDCPNNAPGENSRCDSLRSALFAQIDSPDDTGWTDGCQATVDASVATLTNGEIRIKTDSADDALNQAYTCVKVQMNPPDNVNTLTPSTSDFIRLKTKDNAPFRQIKIEWYLQQEQGRTLDLDDGTIVPYRLPDEWPINRPPIIRAQLLQYNSTFRSSDFDSNYNYNSTLFLLPSIAGASTTSPTSFSFDFRQNKDSGSAQSVACNRTPTVGQYACAVTVNLPDWADPSNITGRIAYLRLSQFYGNLTNYKVTILDDTGQPIRLADVQVAVDSTGRANDIFRRIRSRIDIGASSIPNPEAAIDITKSLCKEFLVTNESAYAGDNDCPSPPTP